nr:pentatricopeptide repeat-containing protein At4g20770 [Ipomoea batatas]
MLAACVKFGDVEAGCWLFERMTCLSLSSWNAMLSGYSQNEDNCEAINLFRKMQFQNERPDRTTLAIILTSIGMPPSEFSYAIVLSSCARLSSLALRTQVHGMISRGGYANDVVVGSALINMYSKCGDIDGARLCFDMMPWRNKPDGVTFIAVLTACSHSGLVDRGIRIFHSMQLEYGVEPLVDHYTCIIDCLGCAGRFDEVEELLNKMSYKDDLIIWEVLLSTCRVHMNVSLARRAAAELFRLDPENSVPYVLLANMYSSLGRWDESKGIREMMVKGKCFINNWVGLLWSHLFEWKPRELELGWSEVCMDVLTSNVAILFQLVMIRNIGQPRKEAFRFRPGCLNIRSSHHLANFMYPPPAWRINFI